MSFRPERGVQAGAMVTPSTTHRAAKLAESRMSGIVRVMGSLVATQLVTSILGLFFWTISAHVFSVDAIGQASAALNAMTLIATLSMLGLGTLLIAELPSRGPNSRRGLVVASVVTVGVVSGAFGVLGLLLLRGKSEPLGAFDDGPIVVLLFAVGVSLTTVSMVLDQAVLSYGGARLQLVRNAVASATKVMLLLCLPLLALRQSPQNLFALWQVSTFVSLVLLAWLARGYRDLPSILPSGFRELWGIRRSAMGHNVLNLSLQAPTLLLPIVVAVVLGTRENAYFATVRLISGLVFMLPYALTIALFSQTVGDPAALLRSARRTIPGGLAIAAVANGGMLLLGGYILRIFGDAYAIGGLQSLHILTLGAFPLVIKDHFVALRRSQGRTLSAARITITGASLALAFAVLGAHQFGLEGACAGWVLALCCEAAFVLPVFRPGAMTRAETQEVGSG